MAQLNLLPDGAWSFIDDNLLIGKVGEQYRASFCWGKGPIIINTGATMEQAIEKALQEKKELK